MAIDRLITKIKLKGSKSFKDKRATVKNIGKVKDKAIFLFKNTLNKKKKKILTAIFIIVITIKLDGAVIKAKEIINPKINSKNTSFLPNLPVASFISFHYNG